MKFEHLLIALCVFFALLCMEMNIQVDALELELYNTRSELLEMKQLYDGAVFEIKGLRV